VRYTTWVEKVFEGFVTAAEGRYDFSLTQVAEALGLKGFDWEAFAKHEPLGDALVAAAYDLAAIDLIDFENVSHGNKVTPFGRDIAERGIRSLRPEISAITLRSEEEAVLARIYEVSRVEEPNFAGFGGADTDAIAADLWPELDAYNQGMRMRKVLGDLDRKHLITRSLGGPSLQGQRPTYLGVVRIAEPDGRNEGLDAGLLDWNTPTAGFEVIEDRLAELKTRLAVARSPDDLSDIGRRCRDIAADAVAVVFRTEMVLAGTEAPSPQDTKGRLDLYIDARVGGSEMSEYRHFLRSSLKLAEARTHSARTGYAAAVAAAQGLLSFVRALEAIERSRAT
jgi:hypothetical protein